MARVRRALGFDETALLDQELRQAVERRLTAQAIRLRRIDAAIDAERAAGPRNRRRRSTDV